MSIPNPLVPQGSLLEQQARSRSTFQMAAFIVALHVVVLGGFLFLGCKKEENQPPTSSYDTFAAPPPVLSDTNSLAPLDPFATPANAGTLPPVSNPIAPPVTQNHQDPIIPAPFVPATPAAGTKYVVKKGDVAAVLARKNGVSLKQLQEANPGKNLAKIKPGDKLNLPAPGPTFAASGMKEGTAAAGSSYTVKGGDNLSRLAKKYGTTIKAIRDANGMTSNDIKVGQKLIIPGKTSRQGSEPEIAPGSVAFPPPTVVPGNPVVPQ